ncbi:MAG: ATP-binding cassette domain-containing protein [Actinomycetes bacterium]
MRDLVRVEQVGRRVALLAVLLALPGLLGEPQITSLARVTAFSIALLSLNVLIGYTGQISLGQAAFVGTGGFVALQVGGRGLPLPLAVLAAGVVVAALTAIVGLPSLRIRGLAVAIATLVYGIAAQNYLFQQPWFVGDGLFLEIPLGRGAVYRFLLVCVAVLGLVVLLDRQLLRSKLGRAFVTVRDGEERAVAFGVEPGPSKLMAYTLSGFMAGLSGALLAYLSGGVSAAEYGVFRSLELLAFTVVGGVGSRTGIIAGAFALIGVPELFPVISSRLAPLVGGLALVLVVLFLPGGYGQLLQKQKADWARLPATLRAVLVGVAHLLVFVVAVREQRFRGIDAIALGGGRASVWPLIVVLVVLSASAVLQVRKQLADRAAVRAGAGSDLEALANLTTAPFETADGAAVASVDGDAPAAAGGEDVQDEAAVAERARRAAANATELRRVPRALSLRMPTRVLFEATDVSVRFGGVQALKDISLEVREGEIVGLIGANGAGKSTFYNVVSGFAVPEPGSSLRYRGRELLDMRPSKRTEVGIARTFQHMGLLRPETVEDNVLLAQHWLARYPSFAGVVRLGGSAVTEKHLRERAGKALEIFGLEDLRHEQLGSLSYGTMRMVELASAVATGADLLFFDEASAGLGPEEAHALGDRFHALRDELGLTLVVIEHHVPLIARTCDYVYCLAAGRKLAEGEPASVQSNPEVIAEFLGRSRIGEEAHA